MERVEIGDCVILKRGLKEIIAVGVVVHRKGNHRGNGDKEWLLHFDGWHLPAYCHVEWRVPPKPVPVTGLTRATIQRVWNPTLIQIATNLMNLQVQPIIAEPAPTEVLTDEEVLSFLINEGMRPAAAEDLTQAFRRIRLLANYYSTQCSWGDILEHETRTFLVMPLLLALGWSEQQLKIELSAKTAGKIDVACFSRPYHRLLDKPNNSDCVLIIETKGFKSGLSVTHRQAKRYAVEFPSCKAVVVTNGYCYKTYSKNASGQFSEQPSAYLNILSPRKAYPLDPENVGGGLAVLKLLSMPSLK